MIIKFLKMFFMVFKELMKKPTNDKIEIPKIIKKKKVIKIIETLDNLIIKFSRKMPLKDNKKNLALLRAIIQQESGFKIKATSVCGARGLMQIMPFLGDFFGVSVDKLYEPKINLKIGVSHFKTQYNYFKKYENIKDMELIKIAVASFNCGRMYLVVAIKILKEKKLVINWKNIKKYLKVSKYKGKIADYKQVVNYVKKVMKNYQKNLI